jgi:hypothetical protein
MIFSFQSCKRRGLWFQDSQGKKSSQDSITMAKNWAWWHILVIPQKAGSLN